MPPFFEVQLRNLNSPLIKQPRFAVVVGGTAGIGLGIAKRLAQANTSVTVLGRNKEAGNAVVKELGVLNPNGRHLFIPMDASLFSSIRKSCDLIRKEQSKLDILVTCQGGAPNLKGRVETVEGLDARLAVHYYGRVLVWKELVSLLQKSSSPRILTVLSAGIHSPYMQYREDPEVKNYSIKKAADAACFYNDIAVECFSKDYPQVFAVHAAPGFVATQWGRNWPLPLKLVVEFAKLFSSSPETCAEFMCEPLFRPQVMPGSFLLMTRKADEAGKTKLHDEAKEFVWSHTLKMLTR